MDINNINILVLSYIGDSVYEVVVREHLINKNIANVKELQEASLNYVSAKGQAELLDKLVDNNILVEEELQVMKRARNAKCNHKPKSCDILTYKHATAFEAIIGYLYLTEKKERLTLIIEYVLGEE